MQAIWNDQTVAESDETIFLEGNYYFPPTSIQKEFFEPSNYTSHCPWKGEAHYFSVKVADKLNENAAWYYPSPKDKAEKIKGYIAFWRGVLVKK